MKQKFLLVVILVTFLNFQGIRVEAKDKIKSTKEEFGFVINAVSFHDPGWYIDGDYPPIDVPETSWRIVDIRGYPAYLSWIDNGVEQNGWILYLKSLRDETQIELTFF